MTTTKKTLDWIERLQVENKKLRNALLIIKEENDRAIKQFTNVSNNLIKNTINEVLDQ